MLKQYISRKEHTVVEEVVDHAERICDHCKKPITSHYWHVEAHHNDWGNDSIDSFLYFDYCSPDCLREALNDYICETDNPFNTEHFEITHHNAPLSTLEKTKVIDVDLDPSYIDQEYLED